MKTISIAIVSLALALTACAQRSDDGSGPDAGMTAVDGGMQIDPPAESATWSCRSGVDANGNDYFEFNSKYLNNGQEASAYIVGQASSEGIGGYFTGTYVMENVANGWYRLPLAGGAEPAELTHAKCVDTTGTNAACWAQYGTTVLSASSAGPYRWCSTNGSCACRFKRDPGKVATPLGN